MDWNSDTHCTPVFISNNKTDFCAFLGSNDYILHQSPGSINEPELFFCEFCVSKGGLNNL